MIQSKLIIIPLFIFLTLTQPAFAAEVSETGATRSTGTASDVSREVKVTQIDNMFLPNEIWVTEGETIRFIVKNKGDRQHEFLIGDMNDLKKAAKMRRNHPDDQSEITGMIRLQPGEQKEIIWTFDHTGVIDFACPLPGHFKGMRGKIYVEKR